MSWTSSIDTRRVQKQPGILLGINRIVQKLPWESSLGCLDDEPIGTMVFFVFSYQEVGLNLTSISHLVSSRQLPFLNNCCEQLTFKPHCQGPKQSFFLPPPLPSPPLIHLPYSLINKKGEHLGELGPSQRRYTHHLSQFSLRWEKHTLFILTLALQISSRTPSFTHTQWGELQPEPSYMINF